MSINTAGKRAPLKIGQLTKFKGDASKESDVVAPQVAKFYSRLYGGGHELATTKQTSLKFRNFAELYLR